MSNKGLLAVVAVTVALIVAAMMTTGKREAAVEQKQTKAVLLEGVGKKIDSVRQIVIERNDGTVTLNLKDDKWTVAENDDFWADDEKVRKLLVGFGSFEALEEKTSNAEWYKKLGVADPKEKDSSSARVTLKDADGKEIAQVIVGNVKSGSGADQTRYVRVGSTPNAWLVRTPLAADGGKSEWSVRNVLNVEPERLRTINIKRWDNEVVNIDRLTTETPTWTYNPLPPDTRVKDETQLTNIARFFQQLSQSDVKKTDGYFDTLTSSTLVAASTWDGLRLELEVRAVPGTAADRYAKTKVTFDESLRPANTDGLKSVDEVKKEAEEINKRLEKWVFQVPSWKVDAIDKKPHDLLDMTKPPSDSAGAVPDKISARHILIAFEGSSASATTKRTKEEARTYAESLQKKLVQSPGSFEEVARQESDDTGSREKGGDLGEFGKGAMVPPFEEAAFALPVDGISGVVESQFGFHIIQRTK